MMSLLVALLLPLVWLPFPSSSFAGHAGRGVSFEARLGRTIGVVARRSPAPRWRRLEAVQGAPARASAKEGGEEGEEEVKSILKGLDGDELDDGILKYKASLDESDPIIMALRQVLRSSKIVSFKLIDSRWNGNEVLDYVDADGGKYFVKMNRVEDPSVFAAEALGLTAMEKCGQIKTPRPMHIGKLPKVGDVGPGAFMVLEHLDLVPFGSMRNSSQVQLAQKIAGLHLSKAHDDLHKGRSVHANSAHPKTKKASAIHHHSLRRQNKEEMAKQANTRHSPPFTPKKKLGSVSQRQTSCR